MTIPAANSVDGIDLSLLEFWEQPLDYRHADFAKLRSLGKPPYFLVPEGPLSTPGDGYYAFVSHADVSAASHSLSKLWKTSKVLSGASRTKVRARP